MMKKSRTTPEEEVDSGPDNLDLVRELKLVPVSRETKVLQHNLSVGTEVAIMKKVDHPNIASVHEVIDVTSDDALLSTSFPPRSWSNLALADLCFLDSRYFMLSPILASIAFTDHVV